MSSPFKQTLESQGDFISIQHDTTTVYSTSALYQGGLSTYTKGNYVGIMRFTNMPNCKPLVIKKISFDFTFESSGYSKNLNFYKCSLLTEKDDTKNGKDYLGDFLGTISISQGINSTVILSKTENTNLFNKLINYLKSASKVENICLYDGEIQHVYAATKIIITIEYDEGLVYYGVNGKWQPCLVYYGVNGKWQQVIPYYGVNGNWQQLGGG